MTITVGGFTFEDETKGLDSQYSICSIEEHDGEPYCIYFDWQWLDSTNLYLVATLDEPHHTQSLGAEVIQVDEKEDYPKYFLLGECLWFGDNNLTESYEELAMMSKKFLEDCMADRPDPSQKVEDIGIEADYQAFVAKHGNPPRQSCLNCRNVKTWHSPATREEPEDGGWDCSQKLDEREGIADEAFDLPEDECAEMVAKDCPGYEFFDWDEHYRAEAEAEAKQMEEDLNYWQE